MTECECNCGYSCDRQCGLEIMECMEKHYVKDCEHDFNGPGQEINNGWTATCKHCGMTAIGHDTVVGP